MCDFILLIDISSVLSQNERWQAIGDMRLSKHSVIFVIIFKLSTQNIRIFCLYSLIENWATVKAIIRQIIAPLYSLIFSTFK